MRRQCFFTIWLVIISTWLITTSILAEDKKFRVDSLSPNLVVEVKCASDVLSIETAGEYVITGLRNGAVEIYDTSGTLRWGIDPGLQYEDHKPSSRHLSYDQCQFFPEARLLAVFRNRYTYGTSIWSRVLNWGRRLTGLTSWMEVWDVASGKRLAQFDYEGAYYASDLQVANNTLAFIADGLEGCMLNILSTEPAQLRLHHWVPSSVFDLAFRGDTLFLLGDRSVFVYQVSQDHVTDLPTYQSHKDEYRVFDTATIVFCPGLNIYCSIIPLFTFSIRSANGKQIVALTQSLDTTIGPIQATSDSLLFESCRDFVGWGSHHMDEPVPWSALIYPEMKIFLCNNSDTAAVASIHDGSLSKIRIGDINGVSQAYWPYPIVGSKYVAAPIEDTAARDCFLIIDLDL